MSKLFTYILNQRLSSWFEQSGTASQAQFAVFVLSSLISHSLKKSNVFCAFIDFTKAYDSIDRNLLYAKLMGYKISGKMLKMIVNIYSKVKSKVRTKVSVQEPLIIIIIIYNICIAPYNTIL